MGVTAAGVIISEQTYGGKIDAGQVAYLKSDGKWYPARANSGATSAGDLAIALDSGVAGGKGRLVKLGYVNNPAWSWTPGAPLYLSAATAGGLTQTRPSGAGNVVREVATAASDPSTIYFDPSPSFGPLATVEGLAADAGDIIVGDDGAWTKVAAGDAGKILASNGAGSLPTWDRVARTATYVVAASDAPDHVKRQADYICDGIDDHEEIHAAIAALPEIGGSICLSPGTFNASIRITKPNVHLFGTWATTIKTLDGIDTTTNSNSATIRVFGDGCLIENLKFDGNLAGNPTLVGDFNACVRSDGIGIYANGCTVRNCWFVDTLGHTIIVWNEADPMGIAAESAARSYVTIEGNLIEGSGTNRARIDVARESASLDKINHHVIIRNNQIKNVSGQAITIHAGSDIIISGNQIDNAGYGVYVHNDLRNIVIAENVVTNITTNSGIRIASTASGASNIAIVSNVVATGVDAGIFVAGPTTATIGHNWIMGCKHAIRLESSGGVFPNDFLIVGNTIESTTEEAFSMSGGAGHAILANRLDKSGYGAIRFGSAITDCTVKENIITNAGTLKARDAVYFETPSRAVVEGNVIRGSTRDGVSFGGPAGADSTIRNNVFSGCTGRSIKTTAARTLIEGNACDAASIEILSTAVDSRISQNTLTSGASLIVAASGAVVRGNGGFVTENAGVAASVADGGTIAHGCAATPTKVSLTGSVAGEIVTVTSIDATNITVAIKKPDGSAGTAQTVYWRAEV